MSDLILTGRARPHYFLPGNVYDAALNRIRWIYDEFDNKVSASTSGGKDSTVVMELCSIVAKERGLGPVPIHFLDQEAEYQGTIDYMRHIRDDRKEDFDLSWYQIPFRLFNATSFEEQWSYVWDERLDDDHWIRPKEPDSIHVNDFYVGRGKNLRQVDRFKEILTEINKRSGGAILTGMRCEESPTRRVFMTSVASYKWATWCSGSGSTPAEKRNPSHYLFHPIYDWTYRDVWKAMDEHGWEYNDFYNKLFQYGVKVQNMRVSSFHHEQSQWSLDYLQELEPETWERATKRLVGISTYGHVGDEIATYYMQHLPYMFDNWIEYTEYLLEHLVVQPEDREKFRRMQVNAEKQLPYIPRREIARLVLYMVLVNDVYGSNMNAWMTAQRHPGKDRDWARWKIEQKRLGKYDESEEIGRATA